MDLRQRPRRCIGLERVNRRGVRCREPGNPLAISRPSLSSSLTVPSCMDSLRKSTKERTSCCFFKPAIVADGGQCPICKANSQQQDCQVCSDASTATTTTSSTCFSVVFLVSLRRIPSCLQNLAMSTSAVSSSSISMTTALTPSLAKSSRNPSSSQSKPVRVPVLDPLLECTDIILDPKAAPPRPPTATSIPALLHTLQNEWDALVLETFALKQQYNNTRQELSYALYAQDAASRVVARLIRERDAAREYVLRSYFRVPVLTGRHTGLWPTSRLAWAYRPYQPTVQTSK